MTDKKTSGPVYRNHNNMSGGYGDHPHCSTHLPYKTNNFRNKKNNNYGYNGPLVCDQSCSGFSYRCKPSKIPVQRSHSNRNQGYDVPAPYNLKNTSQTLHKKAFRSYNSNPRLNTFHHNRNWSYGGSTPNNLRNGYQKFEKSITGWYYVYVLNVEDYILSLKMIQTYMAPVMFHPYKKQYSKNQLKFLVDDFSIAKTLSEANFKIKCTDTSNKKLNIKVTPYYPSHKVISCTPVSSKIKEKMMEVILACFNTNTKNLDLSKFYAHPLFIKNQLFVPLNQPAILLLALNMAGQITKYNLYSLNLENNHIYLGEGLVWIRRLFPELKILKLADNKLINLKDLRSLSGFTIEILDLSRNPVNIVEDKVQYIRYLRNIFPTLKKLDNSEFTFYNNKLCNALLKMPIYLGNSYPIPKNHKPGQVNPTEILVESFITQFFKRYDNDVSRCTIVDAYHENATFSLSSSYLSDHHDGNSLDHYLPYSRNCLQSDQDNHGRTGLVYQGKDNILKLLKKLPNTKHDLSSFVIDVPLANASLIQIIVNGVFIEVLKSSVHNKQKHFRSFSRTFIIVPFRNSWYIMSDMLYITLITDELYVESLKHCVFRNDSISFINNDLHVKLPELEPSLSSKQSENISNSVSPSYQKTQVSVAQTATLMSRQLSNSKPHQAMLTPVLQEQHKVAQKQNHVNKLIMVENLCNETGMNNNWSEKCLEENYWDYTKAILSYSSLKSSIPPEAFIK